MRHTTGNQITDQKPQTKRSILFGLTGFGLVALFASPFLAPSGSASVSDGGFCVQATSDGGKFVGTRGSNSCKSTSGGGSGPATPVDNCENSDDTIGEVATAQYLVTRLNDGGSRFEKSFTELVQSSTSSSMSVSNGKLQSMSFELDPDESAAAFCSGQKAIDATRLSYEYTADLSSSMDTTLASLKLYATDTPAFSPEHNVQSTVRGTPTAYTNEAVGQTTSSIQSALPATYLAEARSIVSGS